MSRERPPAPEQLALLTPLEPSFEALVGIIRGPAGWHEGFGAGLEVYCGPRHGWRCMDRLIEPRASFLLYRRQLIVGLAWDCGGPGWQGDEPCATS